MKNINIYIDGNNLYRGGTSLGYDIDYKKLRGWLSQKYKAKNIYLFIGLVPYRAKFYSYLQDCGYKIIFKQTGTVNGTIKGNCDAELVLRCVSDYYLKNYDECILVTGDGDFGCLVEFLKESNAIQGLVSPDLNKCSILLRNKNVEITYLNEHYHKFSTSKEKAPDADGSA